MKHFFDCYSGEIEVSVGRAKASIRTREAGLVDSIREFGIDIAGIGLPTT